MRSLLFLAGSLAALAFAPAARAQDEGEPEITEAPCKLPGGGEGKLVTKLYPSECGRAGCWRATQVTVEDADERRLFTFDEQLDEGDEPTKVTCSRRSVSLRSNQGELQFALKRGMLELAPVSAAALDRLWTAPAARTSDERTAHANLRTLVALVMQGDADGSPEGLPGVTQETVDLVTLVGARDALALGDYESAEATLQSFSWRKAVNRARRRRREANLEHPRSAAGGCVLGGRANGLARRALGRRPERQRRRAGCGLALSRPVIVAAAGARHVYFRAPLVRHESVRTRALLRHPRGWFVELDLTPAHRPHCSESDFECQSATPPRTR